MLGDRVTLCARGDVYGFGVWVVCVCVFFFSAKQDVRKRLLIFEGRGKQ